MVPAIIYNNRGSFISCIFYPLWFWIFFPWIGGFHSDLKISGLKIGGHPTLFRIQRRICIFFLSDSIRTIIPMRQKFHLNFMCVHTMKILIFLQWPIGLMELSCMFTLRVMSSESYLEEFQCIIFITFIF